MQFTPTGLLIFLYCLALTFPRYLALAISGRRLFGKALFTGKYLVLFIVTCVCAVGANVFALFNSGTFTVFAQILVFMIVGTTLVSAYFAVYIIYWMYGRDMKYQFALVNIIPAPFAILSSALLLLGALLALNWYMLGFAVVYSVTSILFDLKGYRLSHTPRTH